MGAGSLESGICSSHLSSTVTKFCGFLDHKLESTLNLLALDAVYVLLLLNFSDSINEHGSPYGASAQWACRIMLFLKILRKVICIQKMSLGIYSVSQPVSYLERIHLEVMAKSR